jgi:hypothetical protein
MENIIHNTRPTKDSALDLRIKIKKTQQEISKYVKEKAFERTTKNADPTTKSHFSF